MRASLRECTEKKKNNKNGNKSALERRIPFLLFSMNTGRQKKLPMTWPYKFVTLFMSGEDYRSNRKEQ